MKKIITIIILILVTNVTFAQKETSNSKILADEFEQNYNTGDYEAIFLSFSTDMKNAVPFATLTQFLTNLKLEAGNIINRKFVKYETGSVALYKTKFEHAIFGLNISVDDNAKINGFLIKAFKDVNLLKMERNISKLILPFKEEWTVFWGGDTEELNYHVQDEAQKNAFDMVIRDDRGKSYKSNGQSNEDYYAFGKELIAPCDGEIVLVVDGIKDNLPGEMNPVYIPGNTVIIKTINDEYLFFAHFKQHSIQVKQGQLVKQGETLGLCGNSGNSSEPHLHFHIQNAENMTIATGVKCYFDRISVNGEPKRDYSPIKTDKVKSIK